MATVANHDFEEFPVRMIGLGTLRDDHFIQSRVSTDISHARKVTDFVLKNGPINEPITVFDDGSIFRLADGVHRVIGYRAAARVNRRFNQIRAEIRPGGEREANLFAAGANKDKAYLKRTPKDIEKQINMLLEDESTHDWTYNQIASHVGCCPSTARNKRNRYFASMNQKPPPFRVEKRGQSPATYSAEPRISKHARPREESNSTAAEIPSQALGSDVPPSYADGRKLRDYLLSQGVVTLPLSEEYGHLVELGKLGIRGFRLKSHVVVCSHLYPTSRFAEAVGSLMLAWSFLADSSLTPVLVYSGDDPRSRIVGVSNSMKVLNFDMMTVNQFVASVMDAGISE